MAAEFCVIVDDERCQYIVNFSCCGTVCVQSTNDFGGEWGMLQKSLFDILPGRKLSCPVF